MKNFLILTISILALTMNVTNNSAEANMLNKFKKGFYFEKYKNVEEAKAALLELHPIGSEVEGLVKTLEVAGCSCKLVDQNKLENAKKNDSKIRHLTNVIHCELSTSFMKSIVWRVGIMIVGNRIDDIGIGKEYMGL